MASKRRPQGNKQKSVSEALDTKVSESLDRADLDWRDSKTSGQCLSYLYLSQHLSDISFSFKSHKNVQLPAHKFVLSMRSSVFEAMFHGSLAEVGNTVLIEDIDPEIMKVILRFVYSDDPKLDRNNVLLCLYAAKKYALTGLVEQCTSFLESNIDPSNVCDIHEQAVFFEIRSLETKCFDHILINASEVLSSEGFLKVSNATLLKLFKHDKLAEDIMNVFKAAIKWAQNYCKSKNVNPDSTNMREGLGEALFAIRFPHMQIEDFAKVVTPSSILTSEEQVLLYQYIATGGSTPLNKFSRQERLKKTVTVDLTKYSYRCVREVSGCRLVIQLQDSSFGESKCNRNLKIESITGTFVKKIEEINCVQDGSTGVTNYRIEGSQIIFQRPIELNHDMNISFLSEGDDDYEENQEEISYGYQYNEEHYVGKQYSTDRYGSYSRHRGERGLYDSDAIDICVHKSLHSLHEKEDRACKKELIRLIADELFTIILDSSTASLSHY